MDPEKAFAAVAKALGMEEGATPEAVLKKLTAVINFITADEEPAAEPPAEEAEASNEPEDTVAASDEQPDKIEASADSEDAVELDDGAADGVELMEDMAETDPAAGEAGALVTMLAEMTGMDEASVLAALREQAEQVAAVLSGQPDDGMPAEEGETGMSREAESAAVAASRANTKAAQDKLKKALGRIAAVEKAQEKADAETRRLRVELAIRDGHLTRAEAKTHFKLAKIGGEIFEELMSDAAETPSVPTGTVAAGHGSDVSAEDNVSPDISDEHPDIVKLRKRLGHLANSTSGKRALADAKKRITASDYEGRA